MNRPEFQESLLSIMDKKDHWSWPLFQDGKVAAEKLHIHLEQEYATVIRDFPVLLGRVYVRCPKAEVRAELAENIYEEETGGLVAGAPHPELFLDFPKGLGMDLSRFESIILLPAAAIYRQAIDQATLESSWEVGAAVTTLFIEGNRFERSLFDASAPARPPLSAQEHPLVRHYGLPPECLRLSQAHGEVEGEHRQAAWRILLDHMASERYGEVLQGMEDILAKWLDYRQGGAMVCGLVGQGDLKS